MKKVNLKGPFAWAARLEAKALIEALGPGNCRFVGGAVRDGLMGRPVKDVDVATTLTPDEVIKRLQAAGIKPVPTGLGHGTVTAVFKKRHFEVTTLRHDVETFGRRASVSFHDDWEADAARRDFTFNALYLSPEGELFDYFEGAVDLARGRVRFIGDPGKRIQEDALRILRLFRFHAWFGQGDIDRKGLAAVTAKVDLLDVLSPERIRDETFKLLAAPDPVPVLKVMEKAGVLAHVFEGFALDRERLARVVKLETALGRVSALRRLGAFLKLRAGDAKRVTRRFHLSNKEMKRLDLMASSQAPWPLDSKSIRRAVFEHGLEGFRDSLILEAKDAKAAAKALAFAETTKIPDFPVSGRDLEAKGFEPGVAMGEKLKALKARWADSDFKLSKADLLKNLD